MTHVTINDTEGFYEGDTPSLFWEMTICQSLSDPRSLAPKALAEPLPFGAILGRFLKEKLGAQPLSTVLEIGGGMGTLMEALWRTLEISSLTMVDISPRFSALQKERMGGRGEFVVSDIFRWLQGGDRRFDLVIANENMGDFPTVVVGDVDALLSAVSSGPPFDQSPLGRAARLVHDHGLEVPQHGEAVINVGALELVEALWGRAGMVFLSEHSANARAAAPYDFLLPLADGAPRRIRLKDHDEFSINFNHLVKVAENVGFGVERYWMPQFLGVRFDAGARLMAGVEFAGNETAEAVHEFLNHVKEYECVVLTAT